MHAEGVGIIPSSFRRNFGRESGGRVKVRKCVAGPRHARLATLNREEPKVYSVMEGERDKVICKRLWAKVPAKQEW